MTMTDNPVRNGVDTATLFATLNAVKANHEIADFQFRATNRWMSGTHSQSTVTIRGDDSEKLRAVVEQSRNRSAVFDVLTNGVPVAIAVDAG
jgi:hypothetical protein